MAIVVNGKIITSMSFAAGFGVNNGKVVTFGSAVDHDGNPDTPDILNDAVIEADPGDHIISGRSAIKSATDLEAFIRTEGTIPSGLSSSYDLGTWYFVINGVNYKLRTSAEPEATINGDRSSLNILDRLSDYSDNVNVVPNVRYFFVNGDASDDSIVLRSRNNDGTFTDITIDENGIIVYKEFHPKPTQYPTQAASTLRFTAPGSQTLPGTWPIVDTKHLDNPITFTVDLQGPDGSTVHGIAAGELVTDDRGVMMTNGFTNIGGVSISSTADGLVTIAGTFPVGDYVIDVHYSEISVVDKPVFPSAGADTIRFTSAGTEALPGNWPIDDQHLLENPITFSATLINEDLTTEVLSIDTSSETFDLPTDRNGFAGTFRSPSALNWALGGVSEASRPSWWVNFLTGAISGGKLLDYFNQLTDIVPGADATSSGNSANFGAQTGLTKISLPNVTTIGEWAFYYSPLVYIYMPKLKTLLGSGSKKPFASVVNAATTKVWLHSSMNTTANKDALFGTNNWNLITFTWCDDNWTPVSLSTFFTSDEVGNLGTTSFTNLPGVSLSVNDGRVTLTGTLPEGSVVDVHYGSISIIEKPLVNSFVGTWKGPRTQDFTVSQPVGWVNKSGATAQEIESNFRSITFKVPGSDAATATTGTNFGGQDAITQVVLNDVTEIGKWAFYYAPVTRVEMKKLKTIAATTSAFASAVNQPSTEFHLNKAMDTPANKSRLIYGGDSQTQYWDRITFVWYDDNGNFVNKTSTVQPTAPKTSLVSGDFNEGGFSSGKSIITESALSVGQYFTAPVSLSVIIGRDEAKLFTVPVNGNLARQSWGFLNSEGIEVVRGTVKLYSNSISGAWSVQFGPWSKL